MHMHGTSHFYSIQNKKHKRLLQIQIPYPNCSSASSCPYLLTFKNRCNSAPHIFNNSKMKRRWKLPCKGYPGLQVQYKMILDFTALGLTSKDSSLLTIYPSRSQAQHFSTGKYYGLATLGAFFRCF